GVEREAALLQRTVLGAVCRMIAIVGAARRLPRAGVGGQCRHSAVRRIDDERRQLLAVERRDAGAAIEPEIRDAARRIDGRAAVAAIAIVAAQGIRDVLRGLVVGERILAREVLRTLE